MPLNHKQMSYIILMIFLDIMAPILLMTGIKLSSAALINNFEIVATSLIALFIFKEAISSSFMVGNNIDNIIKFFYYRLMILIHSLFLLVRY